MNQKSARFCLFCGAELVGKGRAKEHVLKHSWLKALGVKKTMLRSRLHTGDRLRVSRFHPADSLLVGEVCAPCNNGWMNELDLSVENVILRAAAGELNLDDIPVEVRANLLRWMLKTACVYEYSDSVGHRHLPESLRRHVMLNEDLPRGVAAFWMPVPEASSGGIGVCILDVWRSVNGTSDGFLRGAPQSTRLKFGVQYFNLALAIVWFDVEAIPEGAVVCDGVWGVHQPLWGHGLETTLSFLDPDRYEAILSGHPAMGSFLDAAVASIGVQLVGPA